MRRRWIALTALLGTIVVVGCGGSSADSTPTAVPTHTPSAPTVRRAAHRADLTGFGATTAEWNTTHREAPGGAPGTAYDLDPTLPQVNGSMGVRYFAVLHIGGRVLNYSMAFNPGTTQAEAVLSVKEEFPSDVRVLWTIRKDVCLQFEVASSRLGAALSDPAVGDPRGEALIELGSDMATGGNPSYSPSDVREASLGLGNYTTAGVAPAC